MSNVIDLNKSNYLFLSDYTILFDANIWIYLFYPLGNFNENIIGNYSKVYKEILTKQCKIIVPMIIVSEFFNTCLKFEFSVYKDKEPEKYRNLKRDFRGTQEYKEVVKKLIDTINGSILKNAILINDNFQEMELNKTLFTDEEFDFNDKMLIEICKRYNAKILTHDKDFKTYLTDFDFDILTFNKK